jgi:hypothetical protein
MSNLPASFRPLQSFGTLQAPPRRSTSPLALRRLNSNLCIKDEITACDAFTRPLEHRRYASYNDRNVRNWVLQREDKVGNQFKASIFWNKAISGSPERERDGTKGMRRRGPPCYSVYVG